MVLRFLHLSDIHFGQETKDSSLVRHNHIRDALVKDVEKLVALRGPATRVLVTGDVSYSGKSDEYQAANEWLEKVTIACKCNKTHVSTIPGNHDCDLSAVSHQAKMLYGQLRGSTPEVVQAQLNAIHSDGETASPFLPKLNAYRKFANGFGCGFESAERPMWVRDFELPGGIKLRFHGLTSVQVSDKSDAVGKMVLGNSQFTMSESDNVINIALCHHPLDWFIDEKEASQFLQKNVRLLMVGHEHDVNIQKTEDVFARKEWLVIFAGATNPPEHLVYDYTYNWVELSCAEQDGQHYLVVEVFPRVWVQEKVTFDANRKRLGAQGDSVKVKILCDNVCPTSAPDGTPHTEMVENSPELKQIVDSPTAKTPFPGSSGDSSPYGPQGGSTMQTNDAAFDRLRYLFWRYLNWRQRLKVLVDVDALPHSADQPIPQTLERVALEAASKDAGKLYALWEAMMPLVPEEKRETNPFPKSE
jgi:3',5'-cyclic AMP phosphodiesterase CpdA